MSILTLLSKPLRFLTTPRAASQGRRGGSSGHATAPTPIKPLEPLDNTQAEIPKVGTTDALGG